jgi:hypothetical protein
MTLFAISTVAVCLPSDFSTRSIEDIEVLCSIANTKIEEDKSHP